MTAGLRSSLPGRLPASRDRDAADIGDTGSARDPATPAAVLARAAAAPEFVGPGEIDALQRTVDSDIVHWSRPGR